MDNKTGTDRLQRYAESYAATVLGQFFSSRSRIGGHEILTLCTTPQVNFFTLRELRKAWEKEVDLQTASPYFDYQSPAVEKALQYFRNTLSAHISVDREHLTPLLERSVSMTLSLILRPYDFYSHTFREYGRIKTQQLRSEIKYIKINRPPLDALLKKVEQRSLEWITGEEAFSLLEHILEEMHFVPEDVAAHLEPFDRVFPLEADKLFDVPSSGASNTRKAQGISTEPKQHKHTRASQAPSTVAGMYRKSMGLKAGFTLNQKFMFIRALFSGDANLFQRTIDHLEEMKSFDEVLNYLHLNYPHWNQQSEEYEEFIELLADQF